VSLPTITEALALAVARGDLVQARTFARQAAAHMATKSRSRSQLILSTLDGPVGHVQVLGQKKFWNPVSEPKRPWVPPGAQEGIDRWVREVANADKLTLAGERVMPLLLSGETRCGKTSSIAAVADQLGLPAMRMSLASVRGGFQGETSAFLKKALDEVRETVAPAIWLIDEIDAVAQTRGGDTGSAKDLAHSVGVLLTELDSMPPSTMIAATTNTTDLIDPAVLGRFRVVHWLPFRGLMTQDLKALLCAHGAEAHGVVEPIPGGDFRLMTSEGTDVMFRSYSDVVRWCRDRRVDAILSQTA
jgi:hypothetical protein